MAVDGKVKLENMAVWGIFIWYNDRPVTGNVLRLTSIVEPRKAVDAYVVGEKVSAKCPRYGTQPAVIGKIGGEFSNEKVLSYYVHVSTTCYSSSTSRY